MPRGQVGIKKVKKNCRDCEKLITDEKSAWTLHNRACPGRRRIRYPNQRSADESLSRGNHATPANNAQLDLYNFDDAGPAVTNDVQRAVSPVLPADNGDHSQMFEKGTVKITHHPHSELSEEILTPTEFWERRKGRDQAVPDAFARDDTGKEIPPYTQAFKTFHDFRFAERALKSSLNATEVDDLLDIHHAACEGKSRITFRTFTDMDNVLNRAAERLTPFKKVTISVFYKPFNRHVEFDFYFRDLWDWVLDLIKDPLLASCFVWDAQKLQRWNGTEWVEFFDEPYTAARFWEVQSSLVDRNGKPVAILLYTDESKLSSFGSAKAYPIVARVGNLVEDYRNGRGFGGGRVVGWLPIVEATGQFSSEKKKAAFIALKHTVWHTAFRMFLLKMADCAASGWMGYCGDNVLRRLFAFIMIYCADYKEQALVALIRGVKGLFPCPICLVPRDRISESIDEMFEPRTLEHTRRILGEARQMRTKAEREALLKQYSLRDVDSAFINIANSDPHKALCFDGLHFLSLLFGTHIHPLIDHHLSSHPDASALKGKVNRQFDAMPRWSGLMHFDTVVGQFFNDGSKHDAIAKQMLYMTYNVFDRSNDVSLPILKMLRCYNVLALFLNLDTMTRELMERGRAASTAFAQSIHDYLKSVNESASDIMDDEDEGDEDDDLEEAAQATLYRRNPNFQPALLHENEDTTPQINWNFPKAHLYKHGFDDIYWKGVTKNYNGKLNEPLHRPIREAYQLRTNFKPGFEASILDIEQKAYCMAQLRAAQDDYEERLKEQELCSKRSGCIAEEDIHEIEEVPDDQWHVYLGAKQTRITFETLEQQNVHNLAYGDFRTKLQNFLTAQIPNYSEDFHLPDGKPVRFLPDDESPGDNQVIEYRFLKVLYGDEISYQTHIDKLRCSPKFYGQERRDCVIVDPGLGKPLKFARILFVFTCRVDGQTFRLALIHPFDARSSRPRTRADLVWEHQLELQRVTAQHISAAEFCFTENIVRGTVLAKDHKQWEEEQIESYLVMDILDGDMYLHTEKMKL